MPSQKLRRKWEVNIRVDIHMRRKSPLHGKRVSNHNMEGIKLIATYVLTERSSDTNGE